MSTAAPDADDAARHHRGATDMANSALGRLGIARYHLQRLGRDDLADAIKRAYDDASAVYNLLLREENPDIDAQVEAALRGGSR